MGGRKKKREGEWEREDGRAKQREGRERGERGRSGAATVICPSNAEAEAEWRLALNQNSLQKKILEKSRLR